MLPNEKLKVGAYFTGKVLNLLTVLNILEILCFCQLYQKNITLRW